MPKPLFRGIAASTVTPFTADGSPDFSRIKPHVDWIISDGADAISPLGSSGEFSALTDCQRMAVLESVIDANAGRLPVVAGTGHCTTAGAVALARHAEAVGADAMLIVPPYYMAPTPTQVIEHYRRIAEAVSIPTVLYHNITLTSVDLRTDDLVMLFEEGTIGGVKMSNPEPDRISELLQATGGQLHVYAGIDTVAFEGLGLGAHGWISGIPSMVPGYARKLYTLIANNSDLKAAREHWARLAPLMRMQFAAYHNRGEGPHWFSVMKAALNLIGPPVGDPCPPILPLQEVYCRQLAMMLADLGYTLETCRR